VFLGRELVEHKDYSEESAELIDQEVKKIIDECYLRAKKILEENYDKLNLLANTLLEKEVLTSDEVKKILGIATEEDNATEEEKAEPSPNKKPS